MKRTGLLGESNSSTESIRAEQKSSTEQQSSYNRCTGTYLHNGVISQLILSHSIVFYSTDTKSIVKYPLAVVLCQHLLVPNPPQLYLLPLLLTQHRLYIVIIVLFFDPIFVITTTNEITRVLKNCGDNLACFKI